MRLKAMWWYLFNKSKYHNYKILCWIKDAKKTYSETHSNGLCLAFDINIEKYFPNVTLDERNYQEEAIRKIIPEYYPEYFGTERIGYDYSYSSLKAYPDCGFWWPRNDIESRIKALDKLIQVYENKLK